MLFQLEAPFSPKADQVQAIKDLSSGIIKKHNQAQVLLGITGSGKTFTIANVIQNVQKPTLILAHNKTLAAQLYQEFKDFFPHNAVEYFVSYYDYYQPEAYIPRTDTFIEKDMAINDKIDRLRLSATRSLIERKDVIIVASVSCIYGLGIPEYYIKMKLHISKNQSYPIDKFFLQLVDMHYERTEMDLFRGQFRVKGDVVEVFPAYEEQEAFRIQFFGDEIEKISKIDSLTGRILENLEEFTLYPGSHHVTPEEIRETALKTISEELKESLDQFTKEGKEIERFRLSQRTRYDIEMIKELGFCKGIENYSRHFAQRKPGEPAQCLMDYFPEDFLLVIDESHQTLPQIRAMYRGDRSRKEALVEYGFRLPCAFDNRPLQFEEFCAKIKQAIYVSATPGAWELEQSKGVFVEQIIRPTGLLDPIITIKPAQNQVDDALEEIRKVCLAGDRVLVTTLTKKLAEDLSLFLKEIGLLAKYLHSEIDTIERVEIIKGLRKGDFQVLVGVNLLREGLDIPEVSLVCILDADKEGFLRSETSLIQTCGRAARNEKGRVIMYADKQTDAITRTLSITSRRREIQQAYNEQHGIIPKTISRGIKDLLPELSSSGKSEEKTSRLSLNQVQKMNKFYEKEMKRCAKGLDFEKAAYYRDKLKEGQDLELSLS